MDENYDCGGRPGEPHWRDLPKPGVAQKRPDEPASADKDEPNAEQIAGMDSTMLPLAPKP